MAVNVNGSVLTKYDIHAYDSTSSDTTPSLGQSTIATATVLCHRWFRGVCMVGAC